MPRQARPVRVIRAAAVCSGCRLQTGTDPAGDAQLPAVTNATPGSQSQPEHRHQAGHDDAGDNEQDSPGGHLPAHPATARGQAAAALRSGVFAETVARRQLQARAGQVVRADCTAPCAMPPQQVSRPARRDLRPFPRGRGIRNPVWGRLPGHGDDLLPTASPVPDRGQRPRAPGRAGCSTAADGTAAVSGSGSGSGVTPARLPVIVPAASHRSRTAPPHLRAGTAASRPRCEPRAAARAGPSSPPPLRSPGTRTPPACESSGPHPCGCLSWPRRRFPGPPDTAQAQLGRTGVSVIRFIRFPR